MVTLASNCSVSIVCPKAVSDSRIEMMCSFDDGLTYGHVNTLLFAVRSSKGALDEICRHMSWRA